MKQTISGQSGRGILSFIVILLIGAVLTLAAGHTLSETDQAGFCGSCHVMNEYFRTHQASVHAQLDCNDCHAPYQAMPRMVFKYVAGTDHMRKNISGDIPDIITSKKKTSEVVNASCMNCHTMSVLNVGADDVKPNCIGCHRQVQHQRSTPVSTRRVANE